MNESCYIWMSHVTHEWVMSQTGRMHTGYLRHTWWREHIYDWVMCHTWMRHVAHMKESCRTYEWVMSHTGRIQRGHLWYASWWKTHRQSRRGQIDKGTYEWVVSHIWMRHVSHMNESCLVTHRQSRRGWIEKCTYEWVMSHIWMSHIMSHIGKASVAKLKKVHMNESFLTNV